MRLAEDFRSIARDALNGKWKIAVLVGLVATILGAVYFILGSIIKVGYAKFNLNLIDRLEGSFDNLFAYFSD